MQIIKSARELAIEAAKEEVEVAQSGLQVYRDIGIDTVASEIILELSIVKYETLVNETVDTYRARITKERDDLLTVINTPHKPIRLNVLGAFMDYESYVQLVHRAKSRVNQINIELSLI